MIWVNDLNRFQGACLTELGDRPAGIRRFQVKIGNMTRIDNIVNSTPETSLVTGGDFPVTEWDGGSKYGSSFTAAVPSRQLRCGIGTLHSATYTLKYTDPHYWYSHPPAALFSEMSKDRDCIKTHVSRAALHHVGPRLFSPFHKPRMLQTRMRLQYLVNLELLVRNQFALLSIHHEHIMCSHVNSALLALARFAHVNILKVVRYLQHSTVACLRTHPW